MTSLRGGRTLVTLAPGAAANAQAFEEAAREMVRRYPLAALQLLPELATFREPPQAP